MKIINLFAKRRGMAVVVVLVLAAAILTFGTTYIKSYIDSMPTSKLQLDRVQASFFAKGIQNIALLKIKKYPDFFIRSYRQLMYMNRVVTEGLPPLDNTQTQLPLPFESFMERDPMSGDYGGVFCNKLDEDFVAPLKLASYSTNIAVISSSDFATSTIEINVYVQLQGEKGKAKAVNSYKASILVSKVKI